MSIDFNVDQALAKLGELVAAHGPQAIDTAAHVVQINALNTLSGIPGYGALFALGAWACRAAFRQLRECNSLAGDGDIGWGIAFGACGLFSAAMAYATMASLTDVWAWVGLFNPKLALAHQLLVKFAGM